jgi:hypothetical protein
MAKKKKCIVCEGQKIRNVKDGDIIRIFQSGEELPDNYIPPQSYIDQKIVREV